MKAGHILITRPILEARGYALGLAGLGFEVSFAPMLEIAPLDFEMLDLEGYQGLIFTSAQAVRVFAAYRVGQDFPVFCVGDVTAETARLNGFEDVYSAQGTAACLLPLVQAHCAGGRPFLYVRAADVSYDLVGAFAAEGLRVASLLVYSAVLASGISAEILAKIEDKEVQAVTFFSRRTAEIFVRLLGEAGRLGDLRYMKALCISQGVLECVRPDLWGEALVSPSSDRLGMQALVQGMSVLE